MTSRQDTEECVNNAYLGAWNAIPSARPNPLLSYIIKIVRNISLKIYWRKEAAKRSGQYTIALEEIEACIADQKTVEDEIEARELARIIEEFLDTLTLENRVIFMHRYWFVDSYKDITEFVGLSEKNISVRLTCIRKKMKQYLIEREVSIMNTKKFSDAMSELDTKYVNEALNYKKKAKKPHWIKWGVMATCLCLIVAGAFAFPYFIGNNLPTTLPITQEIAYGFTMKESDVLYLPISFSQRKTFRIVDENAAGLTDENTYKITSNDLGDIMGIVGDSQDESMIGETVYHLIKFPSDDSICIVEVRGTYEFYVKDGVEGIEGTNNPDIIIDAPVDEDTYHEVGPNAPAEYGTGHDDMESSTGTITLEYITELQAKVSAAMSDGDLPFVSSSAVYENPYRLHITVSSNAEDDLAKLKAFDTIGGTLEIVYDTNPILVEDIVTE